MVHLPLTRHFQAALPSTLATIIFVSVYALLIYILSFISRSDPGSIFFDSSYAYTPKYSAYRAKQATNFIQAYQDGARKPKWSPVHDAPLCIGISSPPSAAHVLLLTLGSLLEGMSDAERETLHINILIAHTDPETHAALDEPWLGYLADQVFLYNETHTTEQIGRLKTLESSVASEDQTKKRTLDFAFLMTSCLFTGAKQILMLEDGVLAADGWLHQALATLEDVEEQSDNRELRDHMTPLWRMCTN